MKYSGKTASLLTALLAFCCMLFSASCGSSTDRNGPAAVCSSYPVWLIARDLCAGAENPPEISLLVPPGTGCPHDFEMTAREMKMLSRTGNLLFLYNGSGMDNHILSAAQKANPKLQTVCATDPVLANGDPHFFTSPEYLSAMICVIADGLKAFDPANDEIYAANEQKMLARCKELLEQCKQQKKNISILCMHDSMARFGKAMNCHVSGVIFDDHITALSPAELAGWIEKIRTEKITLLFTEPQTPRNAADTLAQESGIHIVELDSCATGPEDVPEGYIFQIMEQNIRKVNEALQ